MGVHAQIGTRDEDAGGLRLLFCLFGLFVLVRIGVNALVLNRFVAYSSEQGSVAEKIHPAFLGIAACAAIVLATRRIVLDRHALGIARAVLVFVAGLGALMAALAFGGRLTSAGYLIDTYGVACAALVVLLAVPDTWRTGLCRLVLALLVASALVGLAEFALRVRLLPYPDGEDGFRPTGLMSHPLEYGQWCALAIGFVPVARWRAPLRHLAVAVLFLGALASGARIASLTACVTAGAFLLAEPPGGRTPLEGSRRKLIGLIVGALALAVAVAAMAATGALDRLFGGLVDQSSLARVSIYGVFRHLGWDEILGGTDMSRVERIAHDNFGLDFIESSLVVFVVQFGAVGAALFALVLANLFRALTRGRSRLSQLACLCFFAVALSNNALSVKSPDILLLAVLLTGDRGRDRDLGDW